MTKLVVPTEKFFLRFGKIKIFGVGGGNGFGEVCSHTMYAITAKASGSGKIVEGIDEDVNALLEYGREYAQGDNDGRNSTANRRVLVLLFVAESHRL